MAAAVTQRQLGFWEAGGLTRHLQQEVSNLFLVAELFFQMKIYPEP